MSSRTHRPPTHPDVILSDESLISVKVWQPMVRVLHWNLVASVVVLSATGFYIGNPANVHWPVVNPMSTVRTIHFGAAWVLIAVLIARVMLAFTGNTWARWDQFVPVTRLRWAQLIHSIRFYAFLERHPVVVVGHNPLAGLFYAVGVLSMLLVEIVTGIAMMGGADPDGGWQHALSGRLVSLTGLATLRLVHHLVMWLLWVFVVIHVYLSVLIDRVERNGEISSIFGGWKELPAAHIEAELRRDADRRRERYLHIGRRRESRPRAANPAANPATNPAAVPAQRSIAPALRSKTHAAKGAEDR
jgi:Ni/Fe-hydrogenase 1 B-type cytochrome subunit